MFTENSISITIVALIILFMLVVYAHYISTGKKSFEESIATIFNAIYNFFKEQPQEPSPFNTIGFVESVKDNLHRYSAIKQDDLYRDLYEPGHYVVEFIGSEDNLKIFTELLKRCILTSLQYQGYEPIIFAESEQISENTWNVHTYFATTPSRQKSLSEWVARKNALKRGNIANALSSPTDTDLKKDLADVTEANKHITPTSRTMAKIKLGFDLALYELQKTVIPLYAPSNLLHAIIVGGSGSGKSTFLLYFLYNIKKSMLCDFVICDFKRSGELKGITPRYAEFEDCIHDIRLFYEEFLETPEGGNGITKFLIIDEIAGLLTHLSMTKEGKQTADEIRMIMSSILMLGRSKRRFLILSMQRYTASIFPSASGSADNFGILIGLGNLTVDGRRGLFAGEHFPEEEQLHFGTGKGIVLVDGYPLRGLQVPNLDKQKLLHVLQSMG